MLARQVRGAGGHEKETAAKQKHGLNLPLCFSWHHIAGHSGITNPFSSSVGEEVDSSSMLRTLKGLIISVSEADVLVRETFKFNTL